MYPYHLKSIGFIICGNLKEIHLLVAVICGIICGHVDFFLFYPTPGFDFCLSTVNNDVWVGTAHAHIISAQQMMFLFLIDVSDASLIQIR